MQNKILLSVLNLFSQKKGIKKNDTSYYPEKSIMHNNKKDIKESLIVKYQVIESSQDKKHTPKSIE